MADERAHSRVVDPRLYRLAFVPALAALVVVMFSLEGIPAAIDPVTPTGAFDSESAAASARQVARLAPEREAGTPGDAGVADLVADRFREIPAGSVSEQLFETDADGDAVEARNVLLTLPGDAERTVLILANRTAADGPGAASSAAATGVLLEVADALGVAGHESTYVLASTAAGPAGARELIAALPERDSVEAAIVISQPGAPQRREPHTLSSSVSARSGSVQLRRTAEAAIEAQTNEPAGDPGWFTQLARLAFPSGIGEQAVLIADGIDAVAVSAAGERPLPAEEDGPEDLSVQNIDAFGRSTHFLVGAIDIAPPLDHGPATYVEGAENLLPGWTLAALALALLLPALAAAVDAAARVSRRDGELVAALGWAAAWSLPFVGALAVLYALALAGVVPRPEFPFDPGLYPVGLRLAVTVVLMLAALAASVWALRRFRVTGAGAPPGSVAAVGLVAALAGVGLWLANPYLSLLAAPAAHVWLLADRREGRSGAALIAVVALLCLMPTVAALAAVGRALELGADAPWTFTLMIADGQIGLATTVAGCFAAGALVASVVLAAARGGRLPATPGERSGRA
jgi:hypothetical protein